MGGWSTRQEETDFPDGGSSPAPSFQPWPSMVIFFFVPQTPQNNTFHKKKVVFNPTPALPRCRIKSPPIRIFSLSNKNSPIIKILQLIRIPTDKLIPMQLEEWMVETIISDDVNILVMMLLFTKNDKTERQCVYVVDGD